MHIEAEQYLAPRAKNILEQNILERVRVDEYHNRC